MLGHGWAGRHIEVVRDSPGCLRDRLQVRAQSRPVFLAPLKVEGCLGIRDQSVEGAPKKAARSSMTLATCSAIHG